MISMPLDDDNSKDVFDPKFIDRDNDKPRTQPARAHLRQSRNLAQRLKTQVGTDFKA